MKSAPGLCVITLAVVLSISAQSLAQAKDQAPPSWIADPKTGCKIWNPAPQPHESIQWSGHCTDGLAQGEGTLQWIENGKKGDRYVGEYQDGKRNGHGIVTDTHGNRVEGDWRDDELLQMGVNEIDFRTRR